MTEDEIGQSMTDARELGIASGLVEAANMATKLHESLAAMGLREAAAAVAQFSVALVHEGGARGDVVAARVRARMAKTEEEPTDLAPYGYCLDHGGPHPCRSCEDNPGHEEESES